MRLSPAPVRSRMRGARTATGPRPVMIARSGRWPWRTSRWRPSSVCVLAWRLRKAATSASTACANRARAPSRRTSVSGSENSAGWISLATLSWVMAYHSFGGEVEARTPPRYAASTPHAVTNFRAYLGIDRLALVGPLLGAVIPRHHRPVAGRFGISSRRERGPVGRTLAAAVRLSGCVFVEHVNRRHAAQEKQGTREQNRSHRDLQRVFKPRARQCQDGAVS